MAVKMVRGVAVILLVTGDNVSTADNVIVSGFSLPETAGNQTFWVRRNAGETDEYTCDHCGKTCQHGAYWLCMDGGDTVCERHVTFRWCHQGAAQVLAYNLAPEMAENVRHTICACRACYRAIRSLRNLPEDSSALLAARKTIAAQEAAMHAAWLTKCAVCYAPVGEVSPAMYPAWDGIPHIAHRACAEAMARMHGTVDTAHLVDCECAECMPASAQPLPSGLLGFTE